MLFAYSGCLAPQCIPDISSFKALPFRDTESRFTADSSVISSRFSSSFTSSSSKIIIITSIFSSKMDNEHVGASLIVSLSMASLIVTNVFSFSSTSYSSQPSDYIACSPVVLMTNLWLNLLDTHLLAPHLHILVVLLLVWMQ